VFLAGRKIGFLLVLAAICVGFDPRARAQQTLPTFKSSVTLVPISTVVLDRKGKLVTNLKVTDFEVLDKGERRRIVDFKIDRALPISIALLVDVSGSMRVGPKLGFARKILQHLVRQLQDGRDEVAMFTFDEKLHEEQSFTPHPAAIDPNLSNTEPFGTTSLYDAVAATARRLEARPSLRRAVVVFTDGLDTSSVMTPVQVSTLASSIDVPVYVVVTVPPIDGPQGAGRETSKAARTGSDLRDLAEWTGGDLLWATAPEDAVARAWQIVTELRYQYLLAIESAGQAEWRRLDVRVRDRRLTVRARNGYFSRDAPASE
jgi:VWFA-related protein